MRILISGVLLSAVLMPVFAGTTDATQQAAPQQLVQQARKSLQEDRLSDWSYERTTVEKDTTYVERFDPQAAAPQQWQLLSINGQPATAEQLKTYASGKNPVTGDDLAQAKDGTLLGISHSTPDNLQKSQVIGCMPVSGLTELASTDQTVTYHFKPDCSSLIAMVKQDIMNDKHSTDDAAEREANAQKSAETIQDLFSHTEGTLVIARNGPYIESIELKNTEPFTEAHVVKIRNFLISDRFAPVANGGNTVLVDNVNTVQGTAFIFKTVEQHSEVSFSNFRRIVPGA